MKAEEWFASAVRVLGVVVALYGAGYLFDSLLFRLRYFNYPESSPAYYLIAGVAYAAAGLYLMRGAPHLVRFAYPGGEDEGGDPEEERPARQDIRPL